MGRRLGRQSLLIIGMPGTGKTTLERRLTDVYMTKASIDSVFVLDTKGEWSTGLERCEHDLEQQLELLEQDDERARAGKLREYDGPIVHSSAEYHEFCQLLAEERESEHDELVPPRVIWRQGKHPHTYGDGLREGVDQGHVMFVFCEGAKWFPPYWRDWPWGPIRGDVTMPDLLAEGRAHIPDRNGKPCRIHVMVDTQVLQQVHWQVRSFCEIVIAGPIEGGDTLSIIKKEFGRGGRGKELAQEVQQVEWHDWVVLRNIPAERVGRGRVMPPLAPFRGGGRA